MKPKKPRYKGELGKPIYVGSIPIEAANEEQQERIEQGFEQAAINKLPLLMEHYKWSRPCNRDEQKWLETLESRLQEAKREERGGDLADPASAPIIRELEAAFVLAAATPPATIVYLTLALELRFAALCLPFAIEQSSGN